MLSAFGLHPRFSAAPLSTRETPELRSNQISGISPNALISLEKLANSTFNSLRKVVYESTTDDRVR